MFHLLLRCPRLLSWALLSSVRCYLSLLVSTCWLTVFVHVCICSMGQGEDGLAGRGSGDVGRCDI